MIRAARTLGHGQAAPADDLVAALEALADLARRLADDPDCGDELLECARAAAAHAAAATRADPRPTPATAATLARSVARALLDAGHVDAATADRHLAEAAGDSADHVD